ncbi:MAG TPA: hypothetical protein VJZ26_16790 [Blastocatellia bacterium]|nr:hypothetical protein [Blastocatellia bacterium]
MSGDRLQRQIDIIVENQARFSEDMLMLKDALLSLTNIVEQHDQQIAALVEQGRETDRKIAALVEQGRELAALFERHLTEDHGKDRG